MIEYDRIGENSKKEDRIGWNRKEDRIGKNGIA